MSLRLHISTAGEIFQPSENMVNYALTYSAMCVSHVDSTWANTRKGAREYVLPVTKVLNASSALILLQFEGAWISTILTAARSFLSIVPVLPTVEKLHFRILRRALLRRTRNYCISRRQSAVSAAELLYFTLNEFVERSYPTGGFIF